MFYSFRTEIELSLNISYKNRLYVPGVIDIVNKNKQKSEPYAKLVDTAFQNFRNNLIHNQDSFAQQENDEVDELVTTTYNDSESEDEAVLFEDSHQDVPVIVTPVVLDDDLNQKIQSLNNKQSKTFDVIHQWAREFVKNKSAKVPTKIDPLHIFITGKGGCGKSHLLKTLFSSMTKTLSLSYSTTQQIKGITTCHNWCSNNKYQWYYYSFCTQNTSWSIWQKCTTT